MAQRARVVEARQQHRHALAAIQPGQRADRGLAHRLPWVAGKGEQRVARRER